MLRALALSVSILQKIACGAHMLHIQILSEKNAMRLFDVEKVAELLLQRKNL